MRKLTCLLIFTFLLFSCKKDKLTTSLPEATKSGQNILGFRIDSKPWVPNWTEYSWEESCRELGAQFLPMNNQFELSGGIKINGEKSYFRFHIDSLYKEGTYTLNCIMSLDDTKALFIKNGGSYDNVCGPNTLCSITITKFDTTNKIVSGLFQARLRKLLITNLDLQDLYPNSSDFIEITEGRFDVKYNYCR